MSKSRTKNISRNIFFGIVQKVVNLFFPFIVRTILIYTLGAEYLGLNSLFSSILQVLSLTELGVATAMVYSMYKPMAENNIKIVCALLKLYRKLYTIIGSVLLIIGMTLIPILQYLIHGRIPSDINLYILYTIYIINSSLSYLLFGYKQSLFIASQRSYIISKINLIAIFIMYSSQIILLLITHNYYVYIITLPITTISINIMNTICANKYYPMYKCYGEVSREIKYSIVKKTSALFGTKLSSIVLHAADTLVISAFLGLTQVAIYGNYYYIVNAIIGLIMIIFSSITASIGNSIIVETKEKNYLDFCKLTLANFWIVGFCSTCLLCLYQPFMQIWVGEELLYPDSMMYMFVIYFYVYQLRRVVLTYKDAAGIWWEDRFRPYVIMAFNLGTNLILVQIIGIYGVILSTLISMIISIPWENHTVFKYIFKMSSKEYYSTIFYYIIISVIVILLNFYICNFILLYKWNTIIVRLLVCCVVVNSLFYLAFKNRMEFTELKKMIKK